MATIWHTGQQWRVVNALQRLNEAIRAYAPRAVPPATRADSWGSIADDAHSTTSGHYPHFYPVLGPVAVVTARDFPNAPALGLDAAAMAEHLRALKDPRLRYIVSNRRIAEASNGWQWRPYTEDDPHIEHFHVSSARTAIADSNAPWPMPGGQPVKLPKGYDMAFTIWAPGSDMVWLTGPTPLHIGPDLLADLKTAGIPHVDVNDQATLNRILDSQRVAVPAGPDIDYDLLAAALAPQIGSALADNVIFELVARLQA